jgi:hypothetical protein
MAAAHRRVTALRHTHRRASKLPNDARMSPVRLLPYKVSHLPSMRRAQSTQPQHHTQATALRTCTHERRIIAARITAAPTKPRAKTTLTSERSGCPVMKGCCLTACSSSNQSSYRTAAHDSFSCACGLQRCTAHGSSTPPCDRTPSHSLKSFQVAQ